MSEVFAVSLVRTLPPRTGGPVRIVEIPGDGRRLVLWPGHGPVDRPFHPALGLHVGAGHVDGEPVWVEELPAGRLLADLDPGDAPFAGPLCDVVEALATLHDAGFAHGGLDASSVVVDPDGGGWLLGALGEGEIEEDLRALDALVDRYLPSLRGSEEAPEPRDLAGLVEWLRGMAGTWPGTPTVDPARAAGPLLELVLDVRHDAEGGIDEVGFDIGPDGHEPGLLDTWAGRSLSGEEPTGSVRRIHDGGGDRTAVLAHLAAGYARDADPARFREAEGRPSRAVKSLLADEPLDPLPAPEGLPLTGTGFLEPGGHTEITAVAQRPAGPPEPTVEVPAVGSAGAPGWRTARLLWVSLVVVAVAGAVVGALLRLG